MIPNIDVDSIIENSSNKKIKKLILYRKENKKILIRDYDSFIEFLKGHSLLKYYFSSDKYKNRKLLLTKLLKIFCIKKIDIDELFEYIKINTANKFIKVTDWELTEISLLSANSYNEHIKCYAAEYVYRSNWCDESDKEAYKIFKYNNNVIWISLNHEPQYFIIQNGKLFELEYSHKTLTIYKNLVNIFKEISNDNLDNIVTQYKNTEININPNEINLSDYFDKRFFYLGTSADKIFLSDRNYKSKITKIKTIDFYDGLLKIEIENVTYPHTGYILLDIENINIIKGTQR